MSGCPVCGTSTRRRTRAEVQALDEALHEISRQSRPATVRQVFYRAVVPGMVPKCETHGYRPVQRRLLALREQRAIPYDWITDNARIVRGYARYGGLGEYAQEIAMRYRRDYWRESGVQVEVWIEKDALAGVVFPTVVEEYGLELYVTRGFSSVTYLQQAADALELDGRPAFVYVFTDFDPSGLSIADTVRRELVGRAPSVEILVERVAVTREQIDLYGLPTRPTKTTDTRSAAFVALHGTGSVELDAIPPDVLRELVAEKIERHMDPWRLRQLKEQEERERDGIREIEDLIGGAV